MRAVLAGVLVALLVPAGAGAAEYRIVKGETAGPWPAQAHITGSQGILATGCGGSLVSARFVLTAAHCVNASLGGEPLPASAFSVRLGSVRTDEGGKVYGVDAVIRHPGWRSSTAENDAALLHLVEPAAQEPVAVIEEDQSPLFAEGVNATIIGWGLTSSGGDGSETLLQANVPMVGDANCTKAWGSTFKPANQVCAGGTGTDTCQGDSGGPLLVPRDGGFVLAGVTSYGSANNGCGSQTPSVYSRMAAPVLGGWLREQVPTVRLSTGASKAGRVTVLSAGSRGPGAEVPAAWDLDGDGAFDDATGATVSALFSAGERVVRAERRLPDGDRATASVKVVTAAAKAGAPFAAPAGGAAVLTDAVAAPDPTFPMTRLRGGRLRVTFACAAACSARASLVARGRTIASGRTRLDAPGIASVTVKLRRGLPRSITRAKRLRARLTARAGGASLARSVTGRG